MELRRQWQLELVVPLQPLHRVADEAAHRELARVEALHRVDQEQHREPARPEARDRVDPALHRELAVAGVLEAALQCWARRTK